MLSVSYNTTPDYSSLNPPKFVNINRIYNTILIPKEYITNPIQPTDIITIIANNKNIKHKVGLDSGIISFYDKMYYYFYLVPGLSIDNNYRNKYEIMIEDKQIRLNTTFDASHSAKLINGLLVLPNNFNYLFNHTNYGIIRANNKNLFVNILKQQNKYNHYAANTHNTLLYILDEKNTNSLHEINNSYTDSSIRPLFNNNYPLGSCDIQIKGVDNIRIKFGNQSLKLKDKISINYLPSGKYEACFLDSSNNPLIINKMNNTDFNKIFFDVNIESISHSAKTQSSLLVNNNAQIQPNKNYSNLVINLCPYKTSFELFGPNNFYKKFNVGYQKLYNILPGKYTIKYKTYNEEITVIKNDTNYFSNL